MQALDLIEPGFRPLYEGLCVGNKSADAQWVFFEGYLLEPGLGDNKPWAGNLKSAWGNQDYVRKSVRFTLILIEMPSWFADYRTGPPEGIAGHHDKLHSHRERQVQQEARLHQRVHR